MYFLVHISEFVLNQVDCIFSPLPGGLYVDCIPKQACWRCSSLLNCRQRNKGDTSAGFANGDFPEMGHGTLEFLLSINAAIPNLFIYLWEKQLV